MPNLDLTNNQFLSSSLTTDSLFSTQDSLGIVVNSDPPVVIDDNVIDLDNVDTESPTQEIEPIVVETTPISLPDFVLIDNTKTVVPLTQFDLNFSSSGQSIWGLGSGKFIDRRFLGKEWNRSGDKTIASVGVYGSTQGKVGLQSDFELDGGSVNVSLPIELFLSLPDEVTPGETITIGSGFGINDEASFKTTNPYFDYDLDLLFDVDVEAGVKAAGRQKSILNIDRNYDEDLVDLNSDDVRYSVSESQLDGLGSFDIRVPEFEAEGTKVAPNRISAGNNDTFLNANLDLDGLASSILPIPPLEGSFDKSIAGLGAKGSYNVLDLELDAEASIRQEFDLSVDNLTGQLILENGDVINFTVGENITFTVPEGIGDSLEVNGIVGIDTNFYNRTRLGFDVDFDVEALSLSGKIKIPLAPDPGFSLGPIYQGSFDVFDTEFDLYNRSFDLGGFNSQSLSFAIDTN